MCRNRWAWTPGQHQAQRQLNATDVDWDTVETNLTLALGLVSDCERAYRRGGPQVRRRYNQAFWEAIFVDDDAVSYARLAQPFSQVLPEEIKESVGETKNSGPHSGGRGSSKNDFVDLMGRLSNPPEPLDTLAGQGIAGSSETREKPPKQAKGAPNPSGADDREKTGRLSNPSIHSIGMRPTARASATAEQGRPSRTQKRLLSVEVDELIAVYKAGDGVEELAERFGVHRTTVIAHLDRRKNRTSNSIDGMGPRRPHQGRAALCQR